MTLSIKGLFATFIITTFIITTFSITTFSIMTLSITMLCYHAECRILYTILLNVIMLSVIMLSVAMLSVVSPLILIIVSGLLICSKWINEPIFSIYSYDEKSFENYLKIFKKLLLICSFFISVNDKKINIKNNFLR